MFEQVKLSYELNALEPHIDTLTMETHYGKHYLTYTNNLNAAIEEAGLTDKSIEEILSNYKSLVPQNLQTAVRNNGGGFYNHGIYFTQMSPNGGGEPEGVLAQAIEKGFGSFAQMKEALSKASIGQFGSGWGWLATNSAGELQVMASANQDSPLTDTEGVWKPILGIDVWEHAYYLKYKNVRADYVSEIFNVLDWKKIAEFYEKSKA